eukprot:TRINITY_DN1385_c0_g2_i1.p1 TRINITY_DN1385_c0_g2~~TRINITY_DN1385_c0_g2_i1.p1  ORF type:complete len:916 (-),score=259.88 TRINITY_DN1385_c0_g2_i1:52-2799(-)
MALLLWAAAIIGFVAEMPELGISICMVNIINGMFSFWQEFKAEKATEALSNLLPSYMKVLREGQKAQVNGDRLVLGDVILLEEGEKISADAVILESSDLFIDQSTLTGESHPVYKQTREELLSSGVSLEKFTQTPRMNASNIVFAGTSVLSGTGKALVYATGMRSELGKIAHLTQTFSESLSPIQKEMKRLTKMIAVLATSIGVFLFLAATFFADVNIAESFIFSLGMVVAFVPEGVVPLVTLTLAMGTQRMAKHNALIKKLSSVETLGCTNVICSDKTGTLTQNEMTVCKVWLPSNILFKVSGTGYSPHGEIELDSPETSYTSSDLKELLIAGGLCNNASLIEPVTLLGQTATTEREARWTILGDPTEAALVVAAMKGRIDVRAENLMAPRMKEFPFDSRRKRMSTVHSHQGHNGSDPSLLVLSKGAPKEMLDLCTFYRTHGQDTMMTEEIKRTAMKMNDRFAEQGLRVLAIASRDVPKGTALSAGSIEQRLTFLGLMAMQDPARPEVPLAVAKCYRSGIRVVMITGDYGLTAKSIALQIGIVKSPQCRIVTGVDMDQMDDDTLKNMLSEEVIFARVSPEHKYRVVSAFQQLGNIVAATGDGTNDAPALKKADIGVGMGIAGTEVSKEAADMILLDDNFASIVHAVEEGRAVFANIKKFIAYIFASNTAEAVPLVLFIFSKGKIPLALTIMQVLFVDLGTDMVPALALGTEAPEPGIMDRPPRNLEDHLITPSLLLRSLGYIGSIQAVAAMCGFYFQYFLHGYSPSDVWNSDIPASAELYQSATTMALSAVVFCQVGNLFATRNETASFFKSPIFNNKLIWWSIGFEILVLLAVIYVPFLQTFFQTYPFEHWDINGFFLLACIPAVILAEEVRKYVSKRFYKPFEERFGIRPPRSSSTSRISSVYFLDKTKSSL